MATADIGNVRIHSWGLWLFLGILLMLFGLFLIATPILTTYASVFVFGVLLIAAGIVHLLLSLFEKKSNHVWLHLVIAAFTLIIGLLMLFHPTLTLMTLTLLIAVFFLSNGLFRIIGALTARFKGWGWYILNGLISLLLGVLILIHWPSASLWVIGLFIGIDFLFAGLSLIMISLFVKKGAIFA